MSVNKIIISGKLSSVQFNVTESGLKIYSAFITCTEKFRDKETTTSATIKAFGNNAEAYRDLFQNDEVVIVEGSMRNTKQGTYIQASTITEA